MNSQSDGAKQIYYLRPKGLLFAIPILLVFVVLSVGCTYLKPISTDSETFQQQIQSGEAVRQGDVVRVVTQDGVSRWLTVVSVEDDILKGYIEPGMRPPVSSKLDDEEPTEQLERPVVSIPIGDIVLLEKVMMREGKTAAAIGAGFLVFAAIGVAMIAAGP